MMDHPKILGVEEVDRWVERQRLAGKSIGFTCGSFDLIHAGHVQYLREARALCDALVVAVNSDESVRRYKSPLRPVNALWNRQYVLAGLEAVDVVTTLEEDRPLGLLMRWKPDFYIKGGDYSPDALQSAGPVRAYGGDVAVIPPQCGLSTTAILQRIQLLGTHAAPQTPLEREWTGMVMLDRDGTLIENIPFLHDPGKVNLLPGVGEGLRQLQDGGMRLVVVTNQQGIGLGYFGVQEFIAVNQAMLRALAAYGVEISRIYFCPHSLAERCECRKPRPGLLQQAMREFKVKPEDAYVIGDMASDLEAAQAAGCAGRIVGETGSFGEAVAWALAAQVSGGVFYRA